MSEKSINPKFNYQKQHKFSQHFAYVNRKRKQKSGYNNSLLGLFMITRFGIRIIIPFLSNNKELKKKKSSFKSRFKI